MFEDTVVQTSLKRTSGVPQFGVDVEGFDEDYEPIVLVSAKCYHEINAWDFRLWIDEFLRHLDGHWNGKRVRHFVLAITREANDDALNDAARALVSELKRRGIEFHLWDSYRISQTLRRAVHLVDRYFQRYWVDAISASPDVAAPAAPRQVGLTPAAGLNEKMDVVREILGQVGTLSTGFDVAMAARLENAIKDARAGRPSEVGRWLDEARGDPTLWDGIAPPTRARALRAAAMFALRNKNTAAAEALLDEADALSAPTDRSARALLAHALGATRNAITALHEPLVPKERETKVAILIEDGEVEAAERILSQTVGDEVTSEILRLRSIVSLLHGSRREALADALSAHERAPGELAPLLNLAAARTYAVLAKGVRPSVGVAPEPIHPGLVLDGSAARADLAQAANDFGRAMLLAEEDHRPVIEVWRLAALLLNPRSLGEAAAFSGELLARPLPEPLAVAWSMYYGLIEHAGRLKRLYGSAIRGGNGTPTHLVVLALLCAGNDRPDLGRAQIRRHAHRFPEAAVFLEGWRARFGDRDPKRARGSEGTSRGVPHDEDNGSVAAVALAPGADAETVIAAAELLLSQKAWSDLDRLRGRLESIGTVRTIELAALGALRSGASAACLAVLEASAGSFENGHLPHALMHLRIAANENLGRFEPIISDLQAMRRGGNDAFAEARIMDALIRIGDLDRLRQEADKAIDRGSLDPNQAYGVAHALRAAAPSTARKALVFAVRDRPPPEAAGAVMALAADLGLSDLREDMMRIMFTDPAAGRGLMRFDSAEDAIAFMEEGARSHRERLGEWFGGRLPLAVAMPDLATFGRIFLAEEPQRRNHLGDPLPMLLLAGSKREPGEPSIDDVLRLDLSALLLASRLDMLRDLEACFSIQIAPSAGEALIELEASYRRPSDEVLDALRWILGDQSAVRTVREVPPAATSLHDPGDPTNLSAPVLRNLLERAFEAGHLDREQLDRVTGTLEAGSRRDVDLSEGVALTHASAVVLANAGVLEQVARATPTFLASGEAEDIRRNVDAAAEEGRLHVKVADLRRAVADRLANGAWTALPRGSRPDEKQASLPPHVRCLLEAFASQEIDPRTLWIEERTFSQTRMRGLVHLPDVLMQLEERKGADFERRAELLRKARRFGYAYLPIVATEFVAALTAAPVNDRGLIETPTLSELRVWIARDTELTRHISAHGTIPEDGHIIDETRHLLDLTALLRDVLSQVWKAPDTSANTMMARSMWAWTNLRVDRLSGFQADTTPEGRRYFRSLQLTHLLDIPLLAMLDGGLGAKAPWSEFIEWIMAVSGHLYADTDTQVRQVFVDELGKQLRKLLDVSHDLPHDLPPGEAVAIERAFAKLARDYLDLLPDDLSDALRASDGIAGRLGTWSAMVLTVGSEADEKGVRGEALLSDIATAYVAALSNDVGTPGRSKFKLVDGRPVSMETDGADGTTTAAIVIDGHRTRIDAVTLALLAPLDENRAIPDDERERLLDPRGTISSDELTAVERTDDLDARFGAMQRLIDADLYRRLVGMGERSVRRGNIRLDDLSLPAPGAIAAFLRVPLDVEPDGLADFASFELGKRLQPKEVARRLAGLPLDLPADPSAWMDPSPTESSGGQTPHTSPLLSTLQLLSLASESADQSVVDAAVAGLLKEIELHGAFFVAILRHLASAAARDGNWRTLDARVAFAFLWSHADQCVQHLSPPGSDFRDAARWIEGNTSFPLLDRIGEAGRPRWYRRLTSEMTPTRFAASLIGQILRSDVGRRLSATSREALAACCGTSAPDGTWFPSLDLMTPVPSGPGNLWVARNPLEEEGMGAWLAADSPFRERTDDGLAVALLDGLGGAENTQVLVLLLSNVDVARVADATADRIRPAVKSLRATELFEPDTLATRRILSLEARLHARAGDAAAMLEVLSLEAERFAARWSGNRLRADDDGPAAAAAAMLVDVAIEFAIHLDLSMVERFRTFADLVVAIADRWSGCVRVVAARLDAAVRLVDAEVGAELWPALLELRKRA